MSSQEDRRDLARHHTGPSGELGIDGASAPPSRPPSRPMTEPAAPAPVSADQPMTKAGRTLLDLRAIEYATCCDLAFEAHNETVTDHMVRSERLWDAQLHDLVDAIEQQAAAAAVREADAPHGTRLVLVTEDADILFFGRDEAGNKLTFEWGEPDSHGWYTPAITAHYDDNIVAAAVREADALRVERDRFVEVLEQIEAWCDDPLEQIEAKHGTTHRLLMAVIPNTITAALSPTEPAAGAK